MKSWDLTEKAQVCDTSDFALSEPSFADDDSDSYAAWSLLVLKHGGANCSISDVESVTSAPIPAGFITPKESQCAKRNFSPRVHDLAQSRGFLKFQSNGKYEVRMEGDDSEPVISGKQHNARSVVVVHKK